VRKCRQFSGLADGNTIVIPAGSPCADLTVTVVNDAIQNGGRTVTIALIAGGGAQVIPGAGTAAMALVDDEQPRVIPTWSPQGLVLLSLLLAVAVGFSMRRRHR
jgi:hypothetical protein